MESNSSAHFRLLRAISFASIRRTEAFKLSPRYLRLSYLKRHTSKKLKSQKVSLGKASGTCVLTNAKCFPISHHLLLMYCIILDDCFSSVTDPALGINHRNRRSGAVKGYSPPPDRLYLSGICRRRCVEVCVPPKGPEKVSGYMASERLIGLIVM